ncbi:O-antigen polymerase [Rivularia sp. IAM M-261]|nr:O-antigen polymerase [Rivularia sp. IAM M-261]
MKALQSLEDKFTIFCLLFFTGTLEFKSLYVIPEGNDVLANLDDSSPLTPILSLIQHSIFLVIIFLLALNWKNTLAAVSRNKLLIVIIILFLLSFLWSDFPDFTLRRSISLIETSLFGVYLASRYSLKEQLKLIGISLSCSIIIHLIFTLVFPGFGIEYGRHAGAWRGTLEHKNFLGRLMFFSTLVFYIQRPETKKQSIFLKLGFIASFLVVFFSTSKTALFSSVVFIFILIPIYRTLQFNFISATLIQSISLFLIGSCATFFISNIDSIANALKIDLTLTGRTDIWIATMYKLQERIWLGYGYQGFWRGDNGASDDVLKIMGPDGYAPHSHNGFVELALASGLIGIVVFSISFIVTFRSALILAINTKTKEGLWCLVYISFILTYNQTEITLVEHNSIFWVIYVAISLSQLSLSFPSKHHNSKLQPAVHNFSVK